MLVIISFVFCTLYGMLAATIGFYEFSSSGTGFFQMITGEHTDEPLGFSSFFFFLS